MLASETKMTMVKEQLQRESEAWNNRPRFGLFSYNASHGFGFRDEINPKSRRDATGKVRTAPTNFRAGKSASNLPGLDAFTKTGYLSHNDEYVDPVAAIKLRVGDPSKVKKVHSVAFRPSGNNPKGLKAPYEFIADPGRPQEAKIIPKSFVGFTPKQGKGNSTVGHLFSHYNYETDPYESSKLTDMNERAGHAGKILNGPFNSTCPSRGFFTNNVKLYGGSPGSARPATNIGNSNSSIHLKPFLPSDPLKSGYNCTIGKFPEYVGQPEAQSDYNRLDRLARTEGKWKDTYRELSVPTPSVQNYNATYRPGKRF